MEVTIEPGVQEKPATNKDAWPELPMPRDSHLLPEHSQQLLRAARAGRISKPPPVVDEEKENLDDEDENKETQRGFTVRKYVKVPRHLEGPEPEYLAKRRKGLPSQYSVYSGAVGPLTSTGPMRKTKVRKVDNEGKVHVWEVLVPEGATVDGEVQKEETIAKAAPAAAAPGTVVAGVGVVNSDGVVVANDLVQQTPPRRRPPPPKRKSKKGPGRGKKKVAFEPGTEGLAEGGMAADGSSNTLGVPHIKTEGGSNGQSEGDTPMADAQDGDEDDGDEGEDGEDGEEGSDDEDREEGELSPTPGEAPSPSKTVSEPPKESSPPPPTPADPQSPKKPERKPRNSRDPSSSPELPLATAIAHSRQNSLNQVPTTTSPGSAPTQAPEEEVHFSDGEPDLLGSLERHLEKESKSSLNI